MEYVFRDTDKIRKYLTKVHINALPSVSVASLARLQRAHMQTIPFENFDVFVAKPLNLTPEALFQKMIIGRRGGYCFELNTLYGTLLRSLGFEIRPILGRVQLRDPLQMPPRNHLAHLVTLEGKRYISDVGFGGLTTRIPLDIDTHTEINDGEGFVRVLHLPRGVFQIERQTSEGWQPQYSFSLEDVYISDVEMSNHFTETHSDSHFRHSRFAGLFTKTGRIGLYENRFSVRVGPKITTEKEVSNGETYVAFLKECFGIAVEFDGAQMVKLLHGKKYG